MKILIKNKHWNIQKEYNVDKILYLLIDRPNDIDHWNDFVWKNKKCQKHRGYDLPATIWNCGTAQWYKNSRFHRENNKPIIIWKEEQQ